MVRIPEVNLLDDGMMIKVRSHNVEIVISSKDGNILVNHENKSPMVFYLNDDIDGNLKQDKLAKELVITR